MVEYIRYCWENASRLFKMPAIKFADILEILLIAFVVYQIFKWMAGTRAKVFIRIFVYIVLALIVAYIFRFDVILWMFSNLFGVGIMAFIVLLQPELRKVLESLGQKKTVRLPFLKNSSGDEILSEKSIEEMIQATYELAKHKTGALICIQKEVPLKEFETTGIRLDAVISYGLLINIFEHNTPLHDGAVVVKDDRIAAATCYLPISSNQQLSKELGTRHRAAVGLSEVTDSLTIVVSEETGKVSIAIGGNLIRNVDRDYLKSKLFNFISEDNDKKKDK
ncbi:MAG: diadenylate cyclase CdaA [Lachnospiraceae bacterium]|nr:diadenylate cyclase CdaA [Lachnospiraceae bacterium]